MVGDGSMMRPFPIAPLDMVWTGCTEYIPGVCDEQAASVAGSYSSRRSDGDQANGARGRVVVVGQGSGGANGEAQGESQGMRR